MAISGAITVAVLRDLGIRVHDNAVNHGWWEPRKIQGVYVQRNFAEILALIHSECSEALEEWRNNHDYNEVYYTHEDCEKGDEKHELTQSCKPEGIPIEMADIIIRTLDASRFYGIDVFNALLTKHQYNTTRLHRHGGKRA